MRKVTFFYESFDSRGVTFIAEELQRYISTWIWKKLAREVKFVKRKWTQIFRIRLANHCIWLVKEFVPDDPLADYVVGFMQLAGTIYLSEGLNKRFNEKFSAVFKNNIFSIVIKQNMWGKNSQSNQLFSSF